MTGQMAEVRVADRAPARLEQADASSASWEWLAGAAHDMRNPITSIGLIVDAIADDLIDDTTARRYYEQIRKQLHSMTALTDDLIMISQCSMDELPLSTRLLDVSSLISDAFDTMRPVASQCGVGLRAELSPSVGLIRADADRLLRVLLNLLANAIRHSPRRECVLVAATGSEGVLRLEVSDSGPGVSPADRDEVFRPFACTTGHGSRPGHAGLGLAICRAIIECHGGRIWIGSSPRGARFCVEIPACVLPRESLSGRSGRSRGRQRRGPPF